MQTDPEMDLPCRKFNRNLYHFQAGELPEDQQRELADHVAACAGCATRLGIEEGFLRGLKGRLGRADPPPELRARVGQALDREAGSSRAWSRVRTAWLVPAAAAVALALLILPAMPGGEETFYVEREVTVVDIDCERAGHCVDDQRDCRHPHHLNALKVSPGQYWNISLDQELGRKLVADRELRGHRLRVVGELYAGIRTLHVASYTDQPPEAGTTASLRAPSPTLLAEAFPAP
jgi:anti-sigma factor (TIGR02949 family)